MGFYKFFFNYAKQHAIPVFKSFFKAYKDVTGNANAAGGNKGGQSGQKQHAYDSFMSSMMSKTNLSAPPLSETTAMQILNIDKNIEELQGKQVLQRYYTLFQKNDPAKGGTAYLQSKVFAAKECLMARYPNAGELEHEFYKEVVEPEELKQKAENQQKGEQEGKDEKNEKNEKK